MNWRDEAMPYVVMFVVMLMLTMVVSCAIA